MVRRPVAPAPEVGGNGQAAARARAAAERRLRDTVARQREVDSLVADIQRSMRRRPA